MSTTTEEQLDTRAAAVASLAPVSYGLSLLQRLSVYLFMAIPGVIITGGIFLDEKRSSARPVLVALALWLVSYVAAFLVLPTFRLTLSPAGARRRAFVRVVEVAWSGVDAVAFGDDGHGFVLTEPLAGGMARYEAATSDLQRNGFYMIGGTERRWLAQRRWLSLTSYAESIRRGDLAARIDGFAPHLRAVEARAVWLERARQPRPPQPRQSGGWWKLAAVFIGIALAVWGLVCVGPKASNAITLGIMCLIFLYGAAHALYVASVSLWRRDYTRAAVAFACGLPGYMIMYIVISGIVDGVRHPKGDSRPSIRRAAAPTGQIAPAPDRPPAAGGPSPHP